MSSTARNYGFLPTADFANPGKLCLADQYELSSNTPSVVCLYKLFEKMVGGPTIPRNQGKGSDCVGQAAARAVDVVQGVQIAGLGLSYVWKAPACASSIYGGSRVEIGKGRYRMRLWGKGSHVPYAAEFIRDYGCLYMQQYGEHDLQNYRWSRSNEWGSSGVPDELEPTAKLHGIKTFIPIRSWPEWRDAIKNGYPIMVGSSFGFKGQKERDQDGFLEPKGTWHHAMVSTAVDDSFRRPGGLIENSWGPNWVGGPKRHDQPDGSFWVDADVLEDMARKGEAIAISGHKGFKVSHLNIEYTLL